MVPYRMETYVFGPLHEAEYKRDYRHSYFVRAHAHTIPEA